MDLTPFATATGSTDASLDVGSFTGGFPLILPTKGILPRDALLSVGAEVLRRLQTLGLAHAEAAHGLVDAELGALRERGEG